MVWPFSTPFDPINDLNDLTGKVIIVTGGNRGLGFEVVRHLLRKNAKVYLASRSEENGKKAIERLHSEGVGKGTDGKGELLFLSLDLGDLNGTKKAAEEFSQKETRLDILINNAANTWPAHDIVKEGVQGGMIVNYFAPVVFTQTLLPLLVQTSKEPNSDVRIVNVSSGAQGLFSAPNPKIRFRDKDDFSQEFKGKTMTPMHRYSITKLAFFLYTAELQQRLASTSPPTAITAINADPGAVYTFEDRADQLPAAFILKPFFKLAFQKPEVGAWNLVLAAAGKVIPSASAPSDEKEKDKDKYKGCYLTPVGKISTPGKNSRRKDLREELWATTGTLLKEWNVEVNMLD